MNPGPARSRVKGAKPSLSRDSILEVAAEEFRRSGYDATSLETVAARLGVTRPAIYYHFRSKREILDAIYQLAVGGLVRQSSEIAAGEYGPLEMLRRVLYAFVSIMAANQDIVGVYFQASRDGAGEMPANVRRDEISFTKLVADLIRRGQAQGLLRNGDVRLMTNGFLGMMIWMHRWFRSEEDDVSRVQEALWMMAKGGLGVADEPDD